MGQNSYNDEQRVEIGKDEYNTYGVGDPVKIDHDKTTVGYVAEVFPGENGLNGYVLTDKKGEDPADAQHVTVLFAGTSVSDVSDLGADGSLMLGNVPQQCKSAAQELKDTMAKYPNAKVDVYGHSLGSSDGQYALADLDADDAKRVSGWLYEGPNVYNALDKRQQKTADALTASGRVLNYTDSSDVVPIRYGKDCKTVGQWEVVDSKKLPAPFSIGSIITGQHSWGGYQFDDEGKLRLKPNMHNVWMDVDKARKGLDSDRSKLAKANGGKLSHSEKIWLDEQQAGVMVSGMQELAGQELTDFDAMIQESEDKLGEEWKGALSDARSLGGDSLSEGEIRDALEAGGVTRKTMVSDPKAHFKKVKHAFHKAAGEFDTEAGKISSAISKLVSSDQELAGQLGAL